MKTKQWFFISLMLVFGLNSCNEKKQGLEEFLLNNPSTKLTQARYELFFTQPLDHKDPESPEFTQRVVVNHAGYDRPVVVQIEGYSLFSKNRSELGRLLNANEIIIEHRFFAESKPDSMDWSKLNIWQAATDHHKIIQAFKKLYPGKWVSTGISKGGQATIFHRRFYPEDVDVSIPYVAPVNLSDEDFRVYDFLDSVGTPTCRNRIYEFQRTLFKKKNMAFWYYLKF